jgi:hypothetical protein
MLDQYYNMVNSLGGLDKLNCLNNSIIDIINSDEYQTVWNNYWGDNKLFTCARVCGIDNEFTKPSGQYEKIETVNS